MATKEHTFPAQVQQKQPGKEHDMHPIPMYASPDYKPSNKLQGKVAIVTGGDSGIGRSVCYHFAAEGARVAFTYVKGEEERDAGETVEIIKRLNKNRGGGEEESVMAIGVQGAEMGGDEGCHKLVEEVVAAFGHIDVLVNNVAEQYKCASVQEVDQQRLERVFRTNFFSYVYMSRHALKYMKKGGSIINTTSVNAYKGHSTLLDYTCSKGAIVGFTRSLALSLMGEGIRVNGVAPGPIWTPLIPSFGEEEVVRFGKEVPMGRAGQPCEVAPSYVFLASNVDSSYITGQVLHPNGGTIVNG